MFATNRTKFNLHGEFAPGRLSNVHIDLDETTTYSKSSLSFKAKGLQVAYWQTRSIPECVSSALGVSDPAGPGDVSYRAVLEVNQAGQVACVAFKFTNG